MAVVLRDAGPDDADAVGRLHADSWQRHYRGIYPDDYLDGAVTEDRRRVWATRLTTPSARDRTILATLDEALVGFAHLRLDEDPAVALLDNLHVSAGQQRHGVGRTLLSACAGCSPSSGRRAACTSGSSS